MYHLSQAMLNRLTDSHLKLLAAQGAIENPEHFDKTSLSQALYSAQERPTPSLTWENLHDWLLARETETNDPSIHDIRQRVKAFLN
ncbi:MAG: hypothetical protein HC795_08230 [Coleofasciculaceae cyanobacterium RL_1_1]|nr:hypothetical protein [Coleofasciculaceae cyanobacterium RL_1_1]